MHALGSRGEGGFDGVEGEDEGWGERDELVALASAVSQSFRFRFAMDTDSWMSGVGEGGGIGIGGEEEDGDRDREGDVASNQKQNNETEGAEKKEPVRVERRVGDTATYSSVGLRVVGGRALGPCVYAM